MKSIMDSAKAKNRVMDSAGEKDIMDDTRENKEYHGQCREKSIMDSARAIKVSWTVPE